VFALMVTKANTSFYFNCWQTLMIGPKNMFWKVWFTFRSLDK